jgi:two-component system, sensor histidine kinase and response regulator
VNLYSFMRRISDTMRFSSVQKNIPVVIIPPRPDYIQVFVDGQKLHQVLLNLLGNAIKFTHRGQVVLSLHVSHELDDSTKMCNLEFLVRDEGCGIDEMFLRDWKFNGAEKFRETEEGKLQGGSGIGLSVVQGLLDSMGTRLNLESQMGHGTSASFILKDVSYEPTSAPAIRFTQVLLLDPDKVIDKTRDLCDLGDICSSVWCLEYQVVSTLSAYAAGTLVLVPCSAAAAGHLVQIEKSGLVFIRLCNEPSSCQECSGSLNQAAHMSVPVSVFDVFEILCGEQRTPKWAFAAEGPHPKATAQGFIARVASSSSSPPSYSPSRHRRRQSALAIMCSMSPSSAKSGAGSLPSIERAKVLVVDDNALMRQVISSQLQKIGFQRIAVAESGLEAVALLTNRDEHQFDVCLCDNQMPVISGLEVARKVRNFEADNPGLIRVPIVMHSASLINANDMSNDADGFIEKPFTRSKIISSLEKYVCFPS